MLIVTGGAGFIGSNLIRALNARGERDILVVDNLERAEKFRNLAGLQIADYEDKRAFHQRLREGRYDARVRGVYHQGACANTMESDGRYMLENNFGFSRALLDFALARAIPFVYASSAAVYGNGPEFREAEPCERPLNVYGYSKLLFDQHVRQRLTHAPSTVVGLRYFNVYGPNEAHKGKMASMPHQLLAQLRNTGTMRLFGATDGYAAGEQARDFVFVGDVARVNLFFGDGPVRHGVFNVGTGQARSFNAIAQTLLALRGGSGQVEYFPFPDELSGKYQSHTQADLTQLRAAGYSEAFTGLENGLAELYRAG